MSVPEKQKDLRKHLVEPLKELSNKPLRELRALNATLVADSHLSFDLVYNKPKSKDQFMLHK